MADLPLGAEIDWTPARRPERTPLRGAHALLRPVDARADVERLHSVSHPPGGDPAIWTYLPYGPYERPEAMRELLDWAQSSDDPLFFTVAPLPDGAPRARVIPAHRPEDGVIEIGHIWFGTPLQRTTRRPRRSSSLPVTRSTTSATAGSSGSATR